MASASGDGHAHGLAAIAQRQHLLGPSEQGGGALRSLLHLQLPAAEFTLETVRQPSRLYGHSLADLITLADITALAGVDDLTKFDAACQLLRTAPGSVGLRIEENGVHAGMWSVRQPQFITRLCRCSG